MDLNTASLIKIKRGRLTIVSTALLVCVLILRLFAVGYVVIGIVIKVHEGILNDGMIDALNQVWVDGQPIGTMTNALVLTLICLLPVYFLSGFFGILGGICRSKLLLVMHVISVLFFLAIEVIFLVFFGRIIVHLVSGWTKNDFETLWRKYQNNGLTTSEKNSFDVMSHSLKCCGVSGTSNTGCISSSYIQGCYDRYASLLDQYSRAYVAMIVACMIFEIASILLSDAIYRQIKKSEKKRRRKLALQSKKLRENEETIQNGSIVGMDSNEADHSDICCGIFKDFFRFVYATFQKSKVETSITFIKIFMLICGAILVIYGSVLYHSNAINNSRVNEILNYLHFSGYSFRDILRGMAVTSISIGTLTMANSLLGLLNTCFISRSKTALFAGSLVTLLVAKLVVFILWIWVSVKMHWEMYTEMYKQFRGYRTTVPNIYSTWNYFFSLFSCCGLRYYDDFAGSGWSNTIPNIPESCCYYVDTRSEVFQSFSSISCTPKSYTGCIDSMLNIVKEASGVSLFFMSLVGVFEFILIYHSHRTFKNVKKESGKSTSGDREVETTETPVSLLASLRSKLSSAATRSKFVILYWISHLLHMGFGLALMIIGLSCQFDKILSRPHIQIMLSYLSFAGYTFPYLLACFSITLIINGVLAICLSFIALFVPNFTMPKWIIAVVGKFMGKISSRGFQIISMVIMILFLITNIVSLGMWIKVKVEIDWNMNTQLNNRLASYTYDKSSSGAFSNDNSSPWNYLFREGECCGTFDYTSFPISTWYTTKTSNTQRIPTTCCISSSSERFHDGTNTACTDNLSAGTYYTQGCTEVILNKTDTYSNSYFVVVAFMMLTQILIIISTDRIFKYPIKPETEEDANETQNYGMFSTLWFKVLRNSSLYDPKGENCRGMVIAFLSISIVAILVELVYGIGALVLRLDNSSSGEILNDLYGVYINYGHINYHLSGLVSGLMITTFTSSILLLIVQIVGIVAVFRLHKITFILHTVLLLLWIPLDIILICLLSYIFHFIYDCFWDTDTELEQSYTAYFSTSVNAVCESSNINVLMILSWALFAYIIFNMVLTVVITILSDRLFKYSSKPESDDSSTDTDTSGMFLSFWHKYRNSRIIHEEAKDFRGIIKAFFVITILAIIIELVYGIGSIIVRNDYWISNELLSDLYGIYVNYGNIKYQIGGIASGLMISTFVSTILLFINHITGIIAILRLKKLIIILHIVLLLLWIPLDIIFISLLSYLFHFIYDCYWATDTELTQSYGADITTINAVCDSSNITVLMRLSWTFFAYIVVNLAVVVTLTVLAFIVYRKIPKITRIGSATDNEN